jgi:cellulose synthase/poly-beta-1,6-N-acetylglucosamine synthase-like glycosyltransferase
MALRAAVVIPTYDRPKTLRLCLEALRQQTLPKDQFEVFVIKDGKEKPIPEGLHAAAEGLNFTLREIEHGGAAMARNEGIRLASAPIICFTDDDCVPASDWLEQYVNYFEAHPQAIAAGGTVRGIPPTTPVERYIAFKGLLERPVIRPNGKFMNLPTANAAYSMAALKKVNGFSGEYVFNGKMIGAEDLDLTYKVREEFGNEAFAFCPEAVVEHHHRQDLAALVKQHIDYGRGAWVFLDKFDLPYSELDLKPASGWGLMQYGVYLAHRITTKSWAEFRRKKLSILYYPYYSALDFVRKWSYMWGVYLMQKAHNGK